jgi:4-diphosphocytidyl-2-C-methyl-D-erythritol kinase
MRERYDKSLSVRIEIKKRIPIGAGLGGGSSDAAAVLKGVNDLYGMRLSRDVLMETAGELGADVPFFISDTKWAVGRERGDSIEDIDLRFKLWHILLVPPFVISAKDAYDWADGRDKDGADMEDAIAALRSKDVESLGRSLYNDLEELSYEKSRRLRELKNALIEYGAAGAMITGSGPALFGIHKKKEVMALKESLEDNMQKDCPDWKVFIAATL